MILWKKVLKVCIENFIHLGHGLDGAYMTKTVYNSVIVLKMEPSLAVQSLLYVFDPLKSASQEKALP